MNLNLGDTQLIIKEAKSKGLLRNQLAYVLATAYHETAHTMKPVREYGGETYLKTKKYYPYVGMGYVQLTWLDNYKKASTKIGVDFVENPRLLLDPKYATPILLIGMIEGWFTGKKLSDYITLSKSDFLNARRIINGVDKKELIAGYAKEYDQDLKEIGYGAGSPETPVIVPTEPLIEVDTVTPKPTENSPTRPTGPNNVTSSDSTLLDLFMKILEKVFKK